MKSRASYTLTTWLALLVLLVSAGCAQRNLGVGATVTNCCITDFSRYTRFAIEDEGLPSFLRPILEQQLGIVLGEKGLTRVAGGGDLEIRLHFNQEDLSAPVPADPFQGRLDPGGEVRFLADLRIDMVDTGTGETVWTGVLSRIHDVVPGATMPLDSASGAIGTALRELLADYPVRTR